MNEQFEPRTIRVLGDGKERNYEIERYRDFLCYGRKNIEEVCGNCKLRFACFSTRDDVEIPIKEFGKRGIREVTVRMIANKYSNLKYTFKRSKNWGKTINIDRIQINFKKVTLK